MMSTEKTTQIKTRFTEYLIRENALDRHSFKRWIFYPGMLFGSEDKWWGYGGKRDKAHEGLDVCFYMDDRNRILSLDINTKIPVLLGGIVVKVFKDFLGKSIVIEHALQYRDKRRLCTIYGHTIPKDGIGIGDAVKEGEIIASIADAGQSPAKIPSHLHISLGWVSDKVACDRLDWTTMDDPDTITLLDPLDYFDMPFKVLTKKEIQPAGLSPQP